MTVYRITRPDTYTPETRGVVEINKRRWWDCEEADSQQEAVEKIRARWRASGALQVAREPLDVQTVNWVHLGDLTHFPRVVG